MLPPASPAALQQAIGEAVGDVDAAAIGTDSKPLELGIGPLASAFHGTKSKKLLLELEESAEWALEVERAIVGKVKILVSICASRVHNAAVVGLHTRAPAWPNNML